MLKVSPGCVPKTLGGVCQWYGRPEVPEAPGRPAAPRPRYYWHRQDVLLVNPASRSGDERENSSRRILVAHSRSWT